MAMGSGQPNSRVGTRSKWNRPMRSAASAMPSASTTPNAPSIRRAGQESGRSAGTLSATLEGGVDERRHTGDLADQNEHADQQQHHDKRNQPESFAPPQEPKEFTDRTGSPRDIPQNLH